MGTMKIIFRQWDDKTDQIIYCHSAKQQHEGTRNLELFDSSGSLISVIYIQNGAEIKSITIL